MPLSSSNQLVAAGIIPGHVEEQTAQEISSKCGNLNVSNTRYSFAASKFIRNSPAVTLSFQLDSKAEFCFCWVPKVKCLLLPMIYHD